MNREIKFRAWDKRTNHMFDWNDILNGLVGSYEDIFNDIGFAVTQFTGLYDKNGKEIYEGDIVKVFDCKQKDLVVFNKGCFGYFESKFYYAPFCVSNFFYDQNNKTNDIEIIGNKFETPELLEEK